MEKPAVSSNYHLILLVFNKFQGQALPIEKLCAPLINVRLTITSTIFAKYILFLPLGKEVRRKFKVLTIFI